MTKVVFRKVITKDFYGDIIAVFPICWNRCSKDLDLASYEHVGQHGPCSLDFYRKNTKPASQSEYAELLSELRTIYDDLVVMDRLPRLSEVFA